MPVPNDDARKGKITIEPSDKHCHFIAPRLDIVRGMHRGRKGNTRNPGERVRFTSMNIEKMQIIARMYQTIVKQLKI